MSKLSEMNDAIDNNLPEAVMEWIKHILDTVCHDVYHGDISQYAADELLGCDWLEFKALMETTHGMDWQKVAYRNYNYNRSGGDGE